MSDYFFGLHRGHLLAAAGKIAKRHGAYHVNYVEPGTGQRRGWFGCRNYGEPHGGRIALAVLSEIESRGGFEALTQKRDRDREEEE